uniref:Uncharacterized protein n=1 Tax=Arundo donax TaxID=35708 RepID=A0A0A9B4F3_ARUDO
MCLYCLTLYCIGQCLEM